MNELEYVRYRAAMLINYNAKDGTYYSQQGNFDFVDVTKFPNSKGGWTVTKMIQDGDLFEEESALCAAKLWSNLCNNSILWLVNWGILLERFTFFVDFDFHNCKIQWVNNNTGAIILMKNVVFDNDGVIKSAYITLDQQKRIQ